MRLNLSTLDTLDADQRPLVDPRELRPRIVHFGLGAFHRAHQAVYTEAAAARSGQPCGIVAVALRSADTVALLRAQDGLYSLTERAAAPRTRVVGALVEALVMGPDAARIDQLLATPDVTTVTLTVTEKGYARRPDSGALDRTAPGIAADLATPFPRTPSGSAPVASDPDDVPGVVSVIGKLAVGLVGRFRAGGAPIDLVACDNMAGNGVALRSVMREFIAASTWPDRAAVLGWLDTAVGFPDTIVDRIVPAATAADIDAASAALGVRDELPVGGEPYRQWVLQDTFRAARPPWELDGALFVPDVAPYQLTKLRLLNGSHSALAYLGLVAGRSRVDEVLHTEWGERLVRTLGAELAPTLPADGPDAASYVDDLVVRFGSPAMAHQLRQIGSDGSLKLPERWLAALRTLRAAGRTAPTLELALAGWVTATAPDDAGGQRFGTTDPAADRLARRWREIPHPPALVAALLRDIGAPDLAELTDLTHAVAERLPALAAGRVEI